MRNYLIAFAAAAIAAGLGGCSQKAADQPGDNQAQASEPAGSAPKPVETSSELDKLMDAPINPADDGVWDADAKLKGGAKPAEAK